MASSDMKSLFNLLKKILPWLVAAGLFAYLFYQIPPRKVVQALTHMNPLFFGFFAVIYCFLIFVLDTYSLTRVFNRFCIPVTFKEMAPARGVSYLLGLLNYNAGQASIAYYFKRTKGASFFKALGSMLFILVIDLYWVVFFAFIGSLFVDLRFKDFDLSAWVQRLGLVLFIALLVHLAFWRGWFSKWFQFKIHFKFTDWLRGRHLFQTFHQAKVKDYAAIALTRLPIHCLALTSLYIAIRAFETRIPFTSILTTVPVIFLIGALPITPGGLGTVQAATVQFLKDAIHGPILSQGIATPQEILLAMSLAWMAANYLLKALFGVYCLKKVQADLFKEEKLEP